MHRARHNAVFAPTEPERRCLVRASAVEGQNFAVDFEERDVATAAEHGDSLAIAELAYRRNWSVRCHVGKSGARGATRPTSLSRRLSFSSRACPATLVAWV